MNILYGGMMMSEKKQLDLFDRDIRDKDISSITRLFQDVKRYRNSIEFMKKLDFYSSFPYLGVYNAALVEQQRPGAKLVLTVKKWDELYNRKIKAHARPVIILKPFAPVEFLFDIYDTRQKDKTRKVEENLIIEEIIYKHMAECSHDTSFYLNNLIENLPKFGITYQKYVVGSTINSEIRTTNKDNAEVLKIFINKDYYVEHHNYFYICVNMNAHSASKLALLIHELGHLFCQHIRCPWWDQRFFTKEVKEFEAETVSYLVCKRLGIQTNAVEYLAEYMDANREIPPIDINCVFEAVDLIEKMVTENLDVTKCIMYKKDKEFKEKVDKEKNKIKGKKEAAKAARQSF